jgi:predicted ribosomally synthesized peptide with SipW-like signal peptide
MNMDFALFIAAFVLGAVAGSMVTFAWLSDRITATPDVPAGAVTVEDIVRGAGV